MAFKFNERTLDGVLIIDALNLAFRWKHQGRTDFRHQYVETVKSLAHSYNCGTVIITADWGSSSYRKEILPEYKQNRKDKYSTQTEAEKQAFETLLFRGVPGSQVPNAMIGTDESEIKSKYKDYFQDFYGNRRCRTFIMSSSKSSSGRKQAFTSVTLELKINFHALRKDLENKGLIRGFGL